MAEPEVTDVELEGTPAWWWMPLGTARLDEGRIEGFVAMWVEEVDTTAGLAGVDEDEESTT